MEVVKDNNNEAPKVQRHVLKQMKREADKINGYLIRLTTDFLAFGQKHPMLNEKEADKIRAQVMLNEFNRVDKIWKDFCKNKFKFHKAEPGAFQHDIEILMQPKENMIIAGLTKAGKLLTGKGK